MKKGYGKKGTVVLALMLSLSTGVTVFADKNTNNIEASGISPYMDYLDLDDNECDVRWFNINKLTDDEQKELQAVYGRYEELEEEIYGKNYDASEEDIEKRKADHEDELNKLETTATALEEKATDYGDLTEEEISQLNAMFDRYEEIETEIYGQNFDVPETEVQKRFSEYEAEWDELETKEAELEEKAGWICEKDCDGPDGMWYDMSKLTEEEQKELDRIYERYEEIEAAIYGEDFEATDDEIINNYSRYEKELLELEEKASVLEEKAEDYGDLTEDEIRELKNIYEQFEVIGEKILGDDDNLTDEELESRFSKYESEWNELEQKAETLENKAWGK